MKCFSRMVLGVALVGMSLMGGNNAGATMVVNGGFETGDFSGWTTAPAASGRLFGVDGLVPHSGSQGAFFGAFEQAVDSISQAIPTIPGQSYIFEFWLSNDSPGDNRFLVLWGGVPVLDFANTLDFDYTRHAFSVSATSASTLIEFSGANVGGFYNLDDVSVEPVPEPSTFLLLGAGIVGAGLLTRRFRRPLSPRQ